MPVGRQGKYYESIGRRKTAIARVRLFLGESAFLINGKTLEQYFLDANLQRLVKDVLNKMECADKFSVFAKVKGGGINAQAEAIRHGIARTLLVFDPDFRKKLKKSGFLTRDPRMRERKKFGLKRARRAPQWSKR
ncbi:MAG: 30S ribosomal protein S9 [Parcubacteria group bacterium]